MNNYEMAATLNNTNDYKLMSLINKYGIIVFVDAESDNTIKMYKSIHSDSMTADESNYVQQVMRAAFPGYQIEWHEKEDG